MELKFRPLHPLFVAEVSPIDLRQVRDAETLARCFDKRRRQLMVLSETGPVHDEIEPAELLLDGRAQRCHLLVARDVAGQHDWVIELGGELADILFEPLARIGQHQPRAGSIGRLRNAP